MPKLSVAALTLARVYLLSFAVQAACLVVWLVGTYLWVRHRFAGRAGWLLAGGLGGMFACVLLRRAILWWGHRRGWGDDAQPAAAPDQVA